MTQSERQRTPRTRDDLADLLPAAGAHAVAARHALAVTPAMRALITHRDGAIGRQFLPHPDEPTTLPHDSADPVGDDALSPVKGIVHRYPDRALLKPLLVCPVSAGSASAAGMRARMSGCRARRSSPQPWTGCAPGPPSPR